MYLTFVMVQYGQTLLHCAVHSGNGLEAFRLLIDNGADLNITDKVSHCYRWCCVSLYIGGTCLL